MFLLFGTKQPTTTVEHWTHICWLPSTLVRVLQRHTPHSILYPFPKQSCHTLHLTPVFLLPSISIDQIDRMDYSVFNVFKSAIAYDTSIKSLPNLAKEGGEEQMVEYEFEPDTKEEVMQVRQIETRHVTL